MFAVFTILSHAPSRLRLHTWIQTHKHTHTRGTSTLWPNEWFWSRCSEARLGADYCVSNLSRVRESRCCAMIFYIVLSYDTDHRLKAWTEFWWLVYGQLWMTALKVLCGSWGEQLTILEIWIIESHEQLNFNRNSVRTIIEIIAECYFRFVSNVISRNENIDMLCIRVGPLYTCGRSK